MKRNVEIVCHHNDVLRFGFLLQIFGFLFVLSDVGKVVRLPTDFTIRECLIGQMPVFIVNVQIASERGFEVDVDG